MPLPVAMSGKTDYKLTFTGSLQWRSASKYWAPGDTSDKTCTGEISDGEVKQRTVNINYGYYS